jgi:hypothetical protein
VFHAHLTAEERAVVNALRSTDSKDLNVYYAGTSERNDRSTNFVQQTGTQSGWSLPPDDYCNPADANVFAQSDAGDHVSIKSAVQTNAGVLIFDKSSSANLGGDVLAHEILHVLLSPYISDSRQEHGTRNTSTNTPGGFGPQADTTNVMIDPQAAGKIGITRDQSRIINRKDFTGSNLPQLLVD